TAGFGDQCSTKLSYTPVLSLSVNQSLSPAVFPEWTTTRVALVVGSRHPRTDCRTVGPGDGATTSSATPCAPCACAPCGRTSSARAGWRRASPSGCGSCGRRPPYTRARRTLAWPGALRRPAQPPCGGRRLSGAGSGQDLGHDAGADGAAALADGEAQPLVHGD